MPRLSKERLERRQIPLYVAAVAAGLLVAGMGGRFAPLFEKAIHPAIALLLYVTFFQVPVAALKRAIAHRRFMAALLTANFAIVPMVVFGLIQWLPAEPVVRFAAALVLLAPCIDYVVVFASFGKGDAETMLASTPVLLAAQMVLVPIFLELGLGAEASALLSAGPFLDAFIWLIAVPLAFALLTQWGAARVKAAARIAEGLGWMPVPMMGAVLFVVFAAIVPKIRGSAAILGPVMAVYVIFALVMPLVAWLTGKAFSLTPRSTRTLAFSCSIRNSLVVLPIAFAVPAAGDLAASVVIGQTVVELLAVLAYIRWFPRLIRD